MDSRGSPGSPSSEASSSRARCGSWAPWGSPRSCRRSSRGARFGLHHRVIEVVLILLLVFAFAPLKKGLQRVLTMLFFRESDVYRRVLSELIGQMGRGPAYRLSTLTRHVAMTVARTLHVEEAAIVLLDAEGHVTLSTHQVQKPEIGATVHLLAPPGAPAYVLSEDLGDEDEEVACTRE